MTGNHIVQLDYPLDVKEALKLAANVRKEAQPYVDGRYPAMDFNHWQIFRLQNPFTQKIIEDFNVEGKPRFYWLAPNTSIPYHVDHNTTCSINFLLTTPAVPVTFEGDNKYEYTQALLNTSVRHKVVNGNHERILLKISIFNETYEQLAERIKYKKI